MGISLTPEKTGRGWVIEIPAEMAEAMRVAKGSLAVLHTKDGTFEVEVLSPPSPELERAVDRIHEKYKDAFAELKRLGD
jgi:hypothetical protein